MRAYTFTDVSDTVLLSGLTVSVAQERGATAVCLAQLAEVDARRLYVPAGYPSMREYCVDELHLSESSTWKRLQAAHAARRCPALLTAVEEGRLHLAAVCLLAPHLTPENADELIAQATHRRKSEVEQLIAERFPRPELLPLVCAISAEQVPTGPLGPETPAECAESPAPGQVSPIKSPVSRTRMVPLAAERFEYRLSVDKRVHDKFRHAQDLLSHAVPSGDVEQVLERALDALIGQLEKRKFGATRPILGMGTPPQSRPRATTSKRHIPAHVRRAVRERDKGQCTFVGDTGHRCNAKRFLELDHVVPVARGGSATVDGIRLRCRAHNQFEAERVYGAGFMEVKRQEARNARHAYEQNAAEARERAAIAERLAQANAQQQTRAAEIAATAKERAEAAEHAKDVLAGLRELGVRAYLARRAAAHAQALVDAGLHDRMRVALQFVCPKTTRIGRNAVAT